MRKVIKLIVAFVLIVIGIGFYVYSQKDEAEKTSSQTEKTVAVIGKNEFKSQSAIQFTSYKWKDKIPASTRFVLIPYEPTIKEEYRTWLQQLIKEKKVVLFYGNNVEPSVVSAHVKESIDTPEIHSSMSFSFLVFGYGYSPSYKQNVSYFTAGSPDEPDVNGKVVAFLEEKYDQ